MTKIRNKNYERYTVVNNDILKDKDLSITERGMLVTLLSLPDGWDYSIAGLNAILSADGKSKIASSLKKLENKGYLVRRQIKDNQGKFGGYEWEIHDFPQPDLPYPDFPDTDNPYPENEAQSNTNVSKPNISTTDDDIKKIIAKYNANIPVPFSLSQKSKIDKKIIEIGIDQANKILDYVVGSYTSGQYGVFIPRLDWIFGRGLHETQKKMENEKKKIKNQFCVGVMEQNYDMASFERDFLAN